ncbi:MAG: hypothetical protein AB1393_05175 [Candidatus Edwardsbacteria bacterium]
MQDERLKILKMIEEKKITAEEGAKLLEALEAGERQKGEHRPKWFRVRVYKEERERPTVNVNIPFSFLKAAIRLGGKVQMIIPESAKEKMEEKGIRLDDLTEIEKFFDELAPEGQYKLVDVVDEEEGEKVEVFIE